MTTTTRLDDRSVQATCFDCKRDFVVPLTVEQEAAWRDGALIQNVTPQLAANADLRELLISGTCGACFDALFAEEEA